ncbi:hypothetical protein [Streptomyces sp. NPDC092295]|uniref:hypothetical protein n=1 Tax=Streptomyces sp. NPDC092295 TaxID=3366011 RepID=UPI00380BDDAA
MSTRTEGRPEEDTPGTARRVCLAAVTAALSLGLMGACGGGERSDAKEAGNEAPATPRASSSGASSSGASSTGSSSSAPSSSAPSSAAPGLAATPRPDLTGIGASGGKALTQGELDRAILADGDVPGFRSGPMDAPPPRGENADRSECLPLTAVLNGKPEPLGKAVAYRQLVGPDNDRPAVSEFLTTHGVQDASTLLNRLRAAVTACADGFTASGGDGPSTYTGVKRLSTVKAGDDALAYQLTGDFEGDPVPLVFHLVRVGGTVATFYTANFENGATPLMPPALLAAQATKLT